jgi:hypothetical protein
MKNLILNFIFILQGMVFTNCQSVNHTDTVQEREELLRNSYPGCVQWNTCVNYNGYPPPVQTEQPQNNQ